MALKSSINQNVTAKSPNYAVHLSQDKSPVIAHTNVESKEAGSKEWTLVSSTDEIVHPGIMVPKVHCMLAVDGSRTIQPAPFTSLRVGVTLTMPVEFLGSLDATATELDAAFDWGFNWVSQKITSVVGDAEGKTGK
jgi:hypothetical protein